MRVSKTAIQTGNPCVVQKAELISCEAVVPNQFKDNGYLGTKANGQKMQRTIPTTPDEYSGSKRLQGIPSRLGPSRRDAKLAGNRHEDQHDESRSPPVLVEGKEIDLLQLCLEVISYGGYEKATDSVWSVVSNRLGFGLNGGAALKLVYAKYLKNLGTDRNGLQQNVERPSIRMIDCDLGARGSSAFPKIHQESNSETPFKRRMVDLVSRSNLEYKLPTPTGNNSFVGMIEWLRRLALNPGDPRKGQGLRGSKQNEAWAEECETLAMKTRSIFWGRKELIYYGGLVGNMAKQKIPPAVYYKELSKPNTRTLEKLRANQTRAMKCGLHLSGDAMESRPAWLYQTPCPMFQAGSGQNIEPGRHLSNEYVQSMNEALNIGYLLNNNVTRKRIPIGVHFQAQIPQWMGKPKEREKSTKRFGGVRVWPLSDSNRTAVKVGKGRPLKCLCAKQMSIECVRLHIMEEKERLKGELGIAFGSWAFDDMGESVSAQWTDKEQHAFNATVRMNPYSMGKNFWDDLPTVLPLKTVKQLVSFYFNVFVVRRRAIENRIMPDAIDSDDDERELSASEFFSTLGKDARVEFGNKVGLIPTNSGFSHFLMKPLCRSNEHEF